MKKINMKEKGITLIALVITIIVLLILAGVTIATLTGDNGILTKANEAKTETEEAGEDELRRLTALEASTNLQTYPYTDKRGDIATIPAGFAVSQVEGENTIADGLVVIDKNGNEFVWIPVNDINEMAQCSETDGTCDLKLVGNQIVCEKHNNNIEIVGKLYATDIENNFNASTPNTTYNPNSGLREPSIVTGNGDGTGSQNDGNTNNLMIINTILGKNYTKASELLADMKSDYAEMIKSVEKYKGFYISRYEMSKDSNNRIASVSGVTSLVNNSNNKWYELYAYSKTYNTDSVASSMIWGSQYDTMMRWMYDDGKGTNVNEDIGDNRNKEKITGAEKETDIINNIFDLYGCHLEWTLEAYGLYGRVYRGR